MAVLKLLGLTQSLTNLGRTRSALRVMLRFLSASRARSAPTSDVAFSGLPHRADLDRPLHW